MRINARLDETLSKKIEFLKERTEASTTDVLKAAIESYYKNISTGSPSPIELMKKNGFIGCGEGPADLSSNYKKYLKEGWSEKHHC